MKCQEKFFFVDITGAEWRAGCCESHYESRSMKHSCSSNKREALTQALLLLHCSSPTSNATNDELIY